MADNTSQPICNNKRKHFHVRRKFHPIGNQVFRNTTLECYLYGWDQPGYLEQYFSFAIYFQCYSSFYHHVVDYVLI